MNIHFPKISTASVKASLTTSTTALGLVSAGTLLLQQLTAGNLTNHTSVLWGLASLALILWPQKSGSIEKFEAALDIVTRLAPILAEAAEKPPLVVAPAGSIVVPATPPVAAVQPVRLEDIVPQLVPIASSVSSVGGPIQQVMAPAIHQVASGVAGPDWAKVVGVYPLEGDVASGSSTTSVKDTGPGAIRVTYEYDKAPLPPTPPFVINVS